MDEYSAAVHEFFNVYVPAKDVFNLTRTVKIDMETAVMTVSNDKTLILRVEEDDPVEMYKLAASSLDNWVRRRIYDTGRD